MWNEFVQEIDIKLSIERRNGAEPRVGNVCSDLDTFRHESSSGQSDRGTASSHNGLEKTFVAYILLELGRTKRVSSALTFLFVPLHPSALCHARSTRNDLPVCRVVCVNHSEERACAREDDVRLADGDRISFQSR